MSVLLCLPGAGAVKATSFYENMKEEKSSAGVDTAGPVLESLTLPEQASVGDTITITANVTDESGVRNVTALFHGNTNKAFVMNYNDEAGRWTASYQVKDYDHEGGWLLKLVMYDNKGNVTETGFLGEVKVITKTEAADWVRPEIQSVTFNPDPVIVEDAFTIHIKAVDKSGIESITAEISDDGRRSQISFIYDSSNNEWIGTYTFPPLTKINEKSLSILVRDNAGNIVMANHKFLTGSKYEDNKPPEKPTVNEVTETDLFVTGQSEPGAGINVYVIYPYGYVGLGRARAGSDGQFSVPLRNTQPADMELAITATDLSGYTSEAAIVTVKDKVPPKMPMVNEVTDQDSELTGTAEHGSTVEVWKSGELIGTSYVSKSGDGTFTVDFIWKNNTPWQKAGTELLVTATDKAGNISEPTKVIVKDVTPPWVPFVYTVTDKDTVVEGTAESHSIIEVKVGEIVLGTAITDEKERFRVPIPLQAGGTTLLVTATDQIGNVSQADRVQVLDKTPPSKPFVNPITDMDATVKGEAEPGSTIVVYVQSRLEETWSAISGMDGTFTVTIPRQEEGTYMVIYARDDSGNRSESVDVFVRDVTTPAKPTVDEITDQEYVVTGTTEIDTTVIVKAAGRELGRMENVTSGRYRLEIRAPQPAGTVLEVSAVDRAGNISPAQIVVVAQRLKSLVGDNRYATAVKVSLSGWKTANSVILVNGRAIVDGLTATPLASAKDAPILLTAADSLPVETRNELARLKTVEIVLIGGTSVISDRLEKELKVLGYKVTRVGGLNRYDTSLLIAKELDKLIDVKTIYMAYGRGEPDALSIAAQAGLDKQPIILTDRMTVPSETFVWLGNEKLSGAYFIGGETVIAPSIIDDINKITSEDVLGHRISGLTRLETNAKVMLEFYPQQELTSILLAKSETDYLVDALSAGPLAAKWKSPVLLVSQRGLAQFQKEVVNSKRAKYVHQVGGGINEEAVKDVVMYSRK
jgi:putative cell wall-binding protein